MDEFNLLNHPERYRLLFENCLDGMVFIEPDGTIIELNQHMANLLGFSVDEMIAKNVFEFMPLEEKGHAIDRSQKVSVGQIVPIKQFLFI